MNSFIKIVRSTVPLQSRGSLTHFKVSKFGNFWRPYCNCEMKDSNTW
jgi:hypothetical protein